MWQFITIPSDAHGTRCHMNCDPSVFFRVFRTLCETVCYKCIYTYMCVCVRLSHVWARVSMYRTNFDSREERRHAPLLLSMKRKSYNTRESYSPTLGRKCLWLFFKRSKVFGTVFSLFLGLYISLPIYIEIIPLVFYYWTTLEREY